jgi:hypothetical protein
MFLSGYEQPAARDTIRGKLADRTDDLRHRRRGSPDCACMGAVAVQSMIGRWRCTWTIGLMIPLPITAMAILGVSMLGGLVPDFSCNGNRVRFG